MRKYSSKKFLAMIVAMLMIMTSLVSPAMASPASTQTSTSPAASLTQSGNTPDGIAAINGAPGDINEDVTIMVQLEGQTAFMQTNDIQLASANHDSHMATMAKAESRIEATLGEAIEVKNRYSLLFNGFSFVGEAWMADAINEMDGISSFVAPVFELVEPTASEEVNLTPSMSQSTNLTSSDLAWELGYTGEGTTVAILDTGIRQTHEAFSVMPENGKIDLGYLRDVYTRYGDKMHAGSLQDINDIYYSEKLPFNWDYFDNDAVPNHTSSDHGTHVAGIAAGNNGKGFRGVAPDAQIVTMQIFTAQGDATFDTLLLALEDCVYLGVDAVNMSLGVAAWFTSYASFSSYIEVIYDALEAAGVAVCAAAGNDNNASVWNNYGDYFLKQYRWGALFPDTGVIGAPAVFPGSFAVASVANGTKSGGGHLSVNGVEYFPSAASGNPTLKDLKGGEYEIVYVGLGSVEEIEAAGGLEGKIALIERGTLTFNDKAINAANAGAVAYILFNNAPGKANPTISSPIPFANMSREDALKIIATFADGVHGTVEVIDVFSYSAVMMAASSSWGTTADLRIKPEIAAPGMGIISSIGFGHYYGMDGDTAYDTNSGTSMATPHIAGGLLLIKQALREKMPEATAAELNAAAHAVMMSTAHQINGAVRQQGAGLIDLASAVSTEAYLTVDGGRPKLELDDSENGKFTFSFEVNNMGQTDLTYSVSHSAMTEAVFDFAYSGTVMGQREYSLKTGYFIANPETVTIKTMNGTMENVTAQVTLSGPKTITVPAGETVTATFTLSCNADLMAWIEENCEAGNYLEGFIKLNAEDGVNLSMPFLGFVGDWDYAPMFDIGFWWNLPYGVNNMAQGAVSQGTYVGYGAFTPGNPVDQGLGLNPYWDSTGETYSPDRNAISPNGDDYLDGLTYIEFSVMRTPKTVKLYVADEEGNVIRNLHESTYTFRKEFYTMTLTGGATCSKIAFDYRAEELAENETAYLVLEGWLDHEEYQIEDNYNGRMVFPFTVDTTAPQVKVVDGGIEVIDAQYTAYYAVYADAEKTELICENGVFADERATAEFVEIDLDTFYVVTADYARNEGSYMVENGLVYDLGDADIFYGGKTVVARQYIDYAEGYYKYGWLEFNSETAIDVKATGLTYEPSEDVSVGFDYVSAAIAADGTVYTHSPDKLYIIDSETYELTLVAPFHFADGARASAKNIFSNPETGEFYTLGSLRNYSPGVSALDITTGQLTPLWNVTDIPGADQLVSTNWAACMIDATTVAIWGYYGDIGLYDIETGKSLGYIDMNLSDPVYTMLQIGINGLGGSMIYNKDNNDLYCFSNWAELGFDRYGAQGRIRVDLDTNTTTMETLGNNQLGVNGLFFKEDAVPADWYIVYDLINQIGEVELADGDLIKAAREAYDALSEKDQALVDNYDLLVKAEQDYLTLIAENAALNAAKSYALLVINDLEKEAADDTCLLNTIAAAREAIHCATSVGEVYTILDELQLLVNQGCVSNRFSDVAVNAWYHDSVEFVVAFGLMEGMGGKTFAPEANMTRAQLVTVLYRLVGEPEVDGMANPFTDVAADTWYTDAVIWAANNGIITGVTETTFAPNANISREQLVTILYRFFREPETNTDVLAGYADANAISEYAVDAMAWAVECGIVNGITETVLAPQGTATRAQIATILMRVILG